MKFWRIFRKRKSVENIKTYNNQYLVEVYVFVALVLACIIFYPYVYWFINWEMSVVDNIMGTYSRSMYFDIEELKESYPTRLIEAILAPFFLLFFTFATVAFIPICLFFRYFLYWVAITIIGWAIFYVFKICKYSWSAFKWLHKIGTKFIKRCKHPKQEIY